MDSGSADMVDRPSADPLQERRTRVLCTPTSDDARGALKSLPAGPLDARFVQEPDRRAVGFRIAGGARDKSPEVRSGVRRGAPDREAGSREGSCA